MIRWIRFTPLVLVAGAGCLASKGDIRLLQDEFRVTLDPLGEVHGTVANADSETETLAKR